jgi:hypothetical protein
MVIAVKHHSALKGAIGMGRHCHQHRNGEEKGAIGMKKIKKSPFLILVMFTHQNYEQTERIQIFGHQKNSDSFLHLHHDIILATKNLGNIFLEPLSRHRQDSAINNNSQERGDRI